MSEEDCEVVNTMLRYGGGFVKRLALLAEAADETNFLLIKATWPTLWQEYANPIWKRTVPGVKT